MPGLGSKPDGSVAKRAICHGSQARAFGVQAARGRLSSGHFRHRWTSLTQTHFETAGLNMSEPNLPLTGKRILVADDERVSRMIVAAGLRGLGARVVAVSSGSAALRQMLSQPFHAVLVDHDMPGMSGADLCRQLRSLPGLSDTPAILMSARDIQALDPCLGRDRRLAAVLCKPVDFDCVARLLTSVS